MTQRQCPMCGGHEFILLGEMGLKFTVLRCRACHNDILIPSDELEGEDD